MTATLIVLLVILILVELFAPKKDKMARKAVEKLGKKVGKAVFFVNEINDIKVVDDPFSKENRRFIDKFDNLEESLTDEFERIGKTLQNHKRSVEAIMEYLDIKIVEDITPATPEKSEVKAVPSKKEDKEDKEKKVKK